MGKALLIATPSELFDRRARSVVALPEVGGAASECAGLLGAFNSSSGGGGGQGAEYYAPSSSAVEAVRRARHTDFANHPLDVGLAALRTLSAAVQGGEALSQLQPQTAWPSLDTRVRLRVGTAPKTGSLLLTHPVSCLSQPSLHHAVILLVSVSEEHVVGVTINKPFGASPLHSPSAPTPLLGGAVDEARRDKLGPLCEASLHQGGDVSPSSLLALHSLGPLENSSAVSEGLWVTSELHELREAVEADAPHPPEADEGDASPGAKTEPPLLRLKCLVGHAGWAYEQPEAELRRNVWLLLEPEEGTSLAPLALRQPPAALPEGGPSSSAWLRDALWEGVVERPGGAMLEMQGFPGDHAAVRAVARETEALQRELLRKRIDLLVPSEGAKE